MAHRNPNRRFLVTTANTAIATVAVTATAAGWATFGLTDTSSASAAKPQHAISQPVSADTQHRAESLRRLMHKEWWQFDFFGSSRSPVTRTRSSR